MGIGDKMTKFKDAELMALNGLKMDEGFKSRAYTCTAGKLTVGYGRNLEDRGLSIAEAKLLLKNDIKNTTRLLNDRYGWFHVLSEARQYVCINMAFNLGMAGFDTFKKMHAAILLGEFEIAAKEMLDSKWATQVGDRARRLAVAMLHGKADQLKGDYNE